MTHECPGPECQIQVPRHQLMCRTHWYQVPLRIRSAVHKAWDYGIGAGSAAHTSAMIEAIKSVNPDFARALSESESQQEG